MISLRLAQHRGTASFGWLNSKHSFSFGSYYDAQHMGFSALRVINDDLVTAGSGFSTHGHNDMEIISYVLEGTMAHKDSEGNISLLPKGEFQLMSAGSGITHSEYNASNTEPLKFLQIWIQPNTLGNAPSYQQKHFGQDEGLTIIASPKGEDGSLQLKQNAILAQLRLAPHSELVYQAKVGTNLYVHQVSGQLSIEDKALTAGDGAKITQMQTISLVNSSDSQAMALIFDLP